MQTNNRENPNINRQNIRKLLEVYQKRLVHLEKQAHTYENKPIPNYINIEMNTTLKQIERLSQELNSPQSTSTD